MDFSLQDIKDKLINDSEVAYREIKCANEKVELIYVKSLCDHNQISEHIISPLLKYQKKILSMDTIKKEVIAGNPAEEVKTLEEALNHILSGDIIVILPSFNKAIFCAVKGYAKRNIEIPTTETVIKGPREGLTEDINDSISALRRRLKTSQLKVESYTLGKITQTAVSMLYIEGIAPEKLINYVRDKITTLDSEFVLYSNQLEEVLKSKGTPFDTVGYTEKPDVAAKKICEGRVITVFDGTGFVSIAPYFFIDAFQTSDDYTMNKFMAATARILRLISFMLATLAPGLYLALVTYHFRLIPSIFLFKMATARAGVPVPTVIELMTMIAVFQLIREAGIRLPQPIGQTLSIVGALILGDAAVSSGLASDVTVVVVGITSISSYLIPKMYAAIFFWNNIIVLFSAFLGLPGFFMGFIVFVAHIADLTSCGYPYLYPFGTRTSFQFNDIVFRGDLSRIFNKSLLKRDSK